MRKLPLLGLALVLAACGGSTPETLASVDSSSSSSTSSSSTSSSSTTSSAPQPTSSPAKVAAPKTSTTKPAAKKTTRRATATRTHTPTPTRTTPRPAPKPTHTTPPRNIVHPGAFCSPEGATGYTAAGTLMRCKRKPGEPRKVRPRWRRA